MRNYVKSSKEFFLIVLTKKGEYYNLTQIMPFIVTCRHERHHCRNLMDQEVIIVMN